MNQSKLSIGLAFLFVVLGNVSFGIDVLTFHNDNQRTGANLSETVLTQSNVNSTQFGKLYARNVHGIMYAQPLYVSAMTISGGTHNVLIVCTMHDSVYAFDADNQNQAAYWHVSMGTAVPFGEVYTNGDHNMYPEIGVLSTPVIDRTSNTIYLVAMTKEATNSYAHRLHALDLATGAEKFGGPVLITAPAIPGSSAVFSSFRQGQRPALLMANGSLYVAFASFGDLSPYWGWLMRYNTTTLARQNVFNANPANVNGLGSGIWQSGCGPALDAAGNVFLVTGNSNQGAGHTGVTTGNYSETVLKFGPTGLAVADYFTPSDVDNIDGGDADLGGGGHVLLPDQTGSKPHLMVAGGKNGTLYVLDRDNLTHYLADNDARIVQKIGIGSTKGTPVFWNSPAGPHIFAQNENSGNLLSFNVALNAGLGYVQLTQDRQTTFGFQTHQMALSANGSQAGTGIIWTWSGTGGDLIHQGDPPYASTLRAFNAETLAELYNSGQAANGRDTLGGFAKYNTATVANGRVYVPMTGNPSSNSQLVVYGLLVDNTPPTITSVSAVNVNTKVIVTYSKAIDPVSSTNIANYAIDHSVSITGANLAADLLTVTLTTSTLSTGITYTLTVNNVKDQATTPNTIAANTQATFNYLVVPPTISITAPSANASFVAPAVFQTTASVTAGANVSIAKVDFFINGTLSGTVTSAPYSLTFTNIAVGNYSLTAMATDTSNLTATSSAVPITVTNPTGTPYGLTQRLPVAPYIDGQLPPLVAGGIPTTLSQLNVFTSLPNLTPSTKLIPYTVNTPLWSDAALKTRWMAIPNAGTPFNINQQISFSPTGEWSFPNGAVFVKHFDLGIDDTNLSITRRLETRFIVRSSDGNVYGITYKWRSDNTDADLVPAAGLDENITITTATGTRTQTWHYPSQSECLTCHTTAAGGILGVKTRQLNGNLLYPGSGVTDNQLRALNHVGMFNPVLQESAISSYSKLVAVSDTTATLDNRVRSYIDANCANCHRPGGANVQLDARYDTPLYSQHIINAPVTQNLGIAGAKVVVPQDLSRSILYQRTNRVDSFKMPPLARNVIDATAVQTIAAWINGLSLSAGADTLSMQFEDAGTANANNGNNIVTGTAGVVPRNNWNTGAGRTGNNQALIDNNGNVSTATVTWTAFNTWSNGGPNTGGNDSLLKGYLDTDNVTPVSVSVSGVPFSIYDVYVYSEGDGGEHVGQYWAKATASPGGNDPGGKIIHSNGGSANPLQDASATGFGNYAVFRGLTSSTLVVTGQALQYPGGGDGFRGGLNGFQIVDATQSAPALNAVFANSGPTGGGQTITVTGVNLLPNASFTMGGIPVAKATYLSNVAYALTTPAGSGNASIVYSGFNGTTSLTNSYTYGATAGSVGDAISYNFNHNDQGGVNPLAVAESAGVIPRTNWNNSTANVNLATDSNLTDNLGNALGVTAGWFCNEHWTNTEVPDSGGNFRMMRGYINETDTFPMVITASGLPAGFQQFDVYLYTTGQHGNAARHGDIRIGPKTVGANLGASVSYPYAGADATGFLRVPDNNADTTQTGNYVLFPNVTPVSGGLRVEIQSPDNDYRLGIAGFQIVALAPTIIAAVPSGDLLAGGATVTLTGTNFRSNAQSIIFGGAPATNLTFIDSTHYSCTTPAHSAGLVDIVMTDINGRTATLSGQFAYSQNASPTVTNVSPAQGPTTGGTALTINGTNFRAGASVRIGGQNGLAVVNATNVSVINSTTVTCTSPAASPANGTGLTAVQVVNSDFTFGTLSNGFKYLSPVPVLVSLNPVAGPSSGNLAANTVTLVSSTHSFTATGVTVTIGGATVAATTVDDQHVTFVPPAHTAGTVNVSATNGDGGIGNTLTAAYTYSGPTLSACAPSQGTTLGGNTVTLTGTNFGPATIVFFGTQPANSVTIFSTTSLSCVVPPSAGGALGLVNVVVSDNQTPPNTGTLGNGYTYVARAPEFPTSAGKIPGICAKFFASGANTTGVINPTGPSTFDALPPYLGKMVAANAMAGPNSGASPGTILNLLPANSTNFYTKITGYLKITNAGIYTIYTASDDGSIFYFGNTPATTSLVVNNNFAQGVTERSGQIALAAGLHQFTILFSQGGGGYGFSASYNGPDTANAEAIIPDGALYSDPAPAISLVSPIVGSAGGNTPATLSGSGFVSGAQVFVSGVQANNVNVASSTSISFVTPGGPAGSGFVVVINPNGNAESAGFTYDATLPRPPDNPPGAVPGSFFRFYSSGVSGVDPGGPMLPAFANFAPFRSGALATAAYLPENNVVYPAFGTDGFSLQYTGYLLIPSDGTYSFYTASDDGSAMYIGGAQVVANNFAQGITCRTGTALKLKAGLHKYTVQFAEGNGGYGNYIGWGSADASPVIPVDTGTPHGGAPTTQIPTSAYFYVPPTWTGSGTGNWSAAANWNTDTGLGAFSPVSTDTAAEAHVALVLRFPAMGSTSYSANNDAPANLPLNVLEFSGAVNGNSITGNPLQFVGTVGMPYSGLTQPNILQTGSGTVTIAAPIFVRDSLNLGGAGTGVVTLSGALSNYTNGGTDIKNLSKNGASAYVLAGDGSGFTLGTVTVNAGTLCVNSTLNAGSSTVAAGALMRGTGTLGGSLSVAGMLYPGDLSSTLTTGPKGTFTAASADFSTNSGTLRARVWLKDSTHVEADKLILTSTATSALKLDATSKLDLRVEVPGGVTTASNLDVELVHGGDAANNTYSAGFGSVALSYGAPVVNLSVLYVNKNFAANSGDTVNVVATQLPGQSPVPPLTANSYNRIFVRFNNAVTPVKVDSFIALRDGPGVLLEWQAVSEYQNAGYNLARRDGNGEWTRVNAALLPGRLTHPLARNYRYYDWPSPGEHEYRLESVDIHGVPEYLPQLTHLSVESVLCNSVSAHGLEAAQTSIENARGAERGTALNARLAEAKKASANGNRADEFSNDSAQHLRARTARIDRNTDPAVLKELGLAQEPRGIAVGTETATGFSAAPRWFTPSGGAGGARPYAAAKALYSGKGILRIPQSALPNDFNAQNVTLRQGGLNVSALEVDAQGVTVFAPGYSDEYTDKDAFFLSPSGSATPVLAPTPVSGLFDGPAYGTAPATATSEYHDVYFDWSLRPYSYPPWFSSQYLTDNSTQAFTVATHACTGAPAKLILNLWSLTGGGAQSPEHALNAFVNGVPVGHAEWDGGGMALALSFTVPANTLNDGDNSIEFVTPALPGVASQISFVRSISIQYSQALNAAAVNPTNAGGLCVNVSGNDAHVYEIAGLSSSDVWIVDARFPDRARRVAYEVRTQNDGHYALRFAAQPGGTCEYWIALKGSELAPLAVTRRTIQPPRGRPLFIATGPSQFAAALQPLLAQRTKEGLHAIFIDQEQLFDYYGFGRYGPVPIQKATQSLRPRYLLLAGRSTYDYRNYGGANVDPLCPTFLMPTSFWAQATSDAGFADFGHGYPECAVGRFPVNDADELRGAVAHTLSYSGLDPSGWRGQITADQPDPGAGDFAAEGDGLAAGTASVAWSKNYLHGSPYSDQPEVTAALQTAASGGAGVLVYVGHGNAVHLGNNSPHLLDVNSVQAWSGNAVFLQSTCTANWFVKNENDYRSIAIQALTQPQGGIAASLATTTYCSSPPAVDFMQRLIQQAQAQRRWGDALMAAQQYAWRQSWSVSGETGQWYADLAKTECLLGDPALPVFSAPPKAANAKADMTER